MNLSDLIVQLVKTPTWEATREILEANQYVLLTDDAEKAFDIHIINADGNVYIHSLLEEHKKLIQDARQQGINAVFEKLAGKKR